MTVVACLLRVVLAAVMLRAGLLKVLALGEFRDAVRNYRLLPAALVGPVAAAVVAVEIVGGGLLLLGVLPREVAVLLAALLLVFCAAISVNLLRGRTISCGCSGSVASDISWRHVIGNLTMVAALVIVVVWAAEPLSLLPSVHDAYLSAAWNSRALAWLLAMSLAGAGALLSIEAVAVWRLLKTVVSK